MANRFVGSSLDDFLDQQGSREDVQGDAIKQVLAWQITKAMEELRITKAEMARRMNTSRGQLDRLLDPGNDRVELDTVKKAAAAVGRKLVMELG